jgi:cbb3-type cytochrome oxidase subunit 3
MFKYLLQSAGNIEWMAIMPLLLFIVLFLAVVGIALTRSKGEISHMANLPLENDTAEERE